MKLTKYQMIKVKVETPGQTVRFSAATDKLYSKVEGIYVSLPKDESHYGSTMELRIAEQEIFPEGFETKLLATDQSSTPNERFVIFDNDEVVEAGGSIIEGRFTDGGFSDGITFPYSLNIYLKLKNVQ
ncbi:MAG: hypothetical protein A2W93_12150 [Bacteroidetes bacterium GWF2_43_63]|nr:MAG: hypothetical protein A2W94_15640 [Bacteroidetes bacterium GWE2_42_42]OFY56374.1 MAG: hypothetical protein A2W93_12150 [Bacteroidetes bacterium GWF2_43_63]HBG69660.1 hypothetical protein [Bacteroidales bacterium]HCB61927.1 hypothetical protein [Bacteroidales bacterium]HCY42294.1 hypothetical protein [Prolixibacteraceae bacterium]